MVDPVLMSGLLDESHHPSDSSHGVGLKPERERQEEHRLRVGRALDRGKERVVDGQHKLPLHARKLANEPVVHPQPAPVAERVRVRLLDRRSRRRTDVREEERRGDAGGELAEVAVVPGRVRAAVEPGCRNSLVPAEPKPSPFVGVAPCLACRLWSINERSRLTSSLESDR
jgi:hypothetical protein